MSEEKAKYAGKTASEWDEEVKKSLGCIVVAGLLGYIFLALGFGYYLGIGAFFIVIAMGLLAIAVRFLFVAREERVKQKKAEESQNG